MNNAAQPQPITPLPKGFSVIEDDNTPALPAGFSFAEDDQKKSRISNSGGKMSFPGSGVFPPLTTTPAKPTVLTDKGAAAYDKQVKEGVAKTERLSKDLRQAQGAYVSTQGVEDGKYMQQAREMSSAARLAGAIKEDKGRSGNRFGYIYNQMLKGIGGAVSGVADAAIVLAEKLPTGDANIEDGTLLSDYRENGAPIVREYLKANIGADVDKGRERKFDDEFITSALGGLAYSAPAMVTPYGIGLFSQAYDTGLISINSSEEGRKLSEGQKTLYAGLIGSIVGTLEKTGLERIFGKSSVSQRAIDGLVVKAVDAAKRDGIKLTSDYFDKYIGKEINSLSAKLLRTGKNVGEASAIEGITGGLQELATIGSERITNALTNKDVFDEQSLGEMTGRVLKASAAEAIGGGILGGVKSFQNTSTKSELVNRIASVKSFEDNRNLLIDIEKAATDLGLNEAEIEDITNSLDQYQKIIERLPTELPAEAKAKIIPLVEEREDIIEAMKGEVDKLGKIDDAFKPNQSAKIEALNERVMEINNQISKGADIVNEDVSVTKETELAGTGIALSNNEGSQDQSSNSTVNTPIEQADIQQVTEVIPEPSLNESRASLVDPVTQLGSNEGLQIESTPDADAVLDRAEQDLQILKNVRDKAKKYEASMGRLESARNAKTISEEDFSDFEARFNDVINEWKPKKSESKAVEVSELSSDLEGVEQEMELDFSELDADSDMQVEGVIETPAADKLKEIRIRRQEILKSISARTRQLNSGFDPSVLQDLAKLGGTYIEEGVVNFQKFSQNMRRDYGNIPYGVMRDIYHSAAATVGLTVNSSTENRSDFHKKDLISRLTQMKRRMNSEVIGGKMKLNDIKELRDSFSEMKNEAIKGKLLSGDVSGRSMAVLADKASKIKDENTLAEAVSYFQKIMEDIEFGNKVDIAKKLAGKALAVSNSGLAKKQLTLQKLLKDFAGLTKAISYIPDIDKYNEIGTRILDKSGNLAINNEELRAYIEKVQSEKSEIKTKEKAAAALVREKKLLDRIDDLTPEGYTGSANDLYTSKIEYDGKIEDEADEGDVSDNVRVLRSIIEKNRADLPKSIEGKNESETLEALKGISIDNLSLADLKILNTLISNAVVNNEYNEGSWRFVASYQAQESVAEISQVHKANLGKARQATSEVWYKLLLPSKNDVSDRQLFLNLNPLREFGLDLHAKILGGVYAGYNRARHRSQKEVKAALKIIKENKLDMEAIYRIGIAAHLMKWESDGRWSSQQEAFDVKKKQVMDSFELLKKALVSGKDTLYSGKKRSIRKQVSFLEIPVAELARIDSPEKFVNFLNPKQKILYNHFLTAFNSTKEEMLQMYSGLGVKWTEQENYFPESYQALESAADESEDIVMEGFLNPLSVDIEGKSTGELKIKKDLPNFGGARAVLNLNSLELFSRRFAEQLGEAETIKPRMKAKSILVSRDIREMVNGGGKVNNMTTIYDKSREVINDLRGTVNFKFESLGGFESVTQKLSGLFYASTIGSFDQIFKQVIPSTAAIILTTSPKAYSQGLKLSTFSTRSVSEFLINSGSSAGARIRETVYNKIGDEMESNNAEKMGDTIKWLTDSKKTWFDFLLSPLQSGDKENTINAFLSGYIQSLADQGLIKDASDFTKEMMEEHSIKPNKKAVEVGDGLVEAVNAAGQKASRATSLKARSTAKRVFDLILGNYLRSFSKSTNIEGKLALRNLIAGQSNQREYQRLAGYTASLTISAALTYLIGTAIRAGAKDIVGYITGEDEAEQARERLAAKRGFVNNEHREHVMDIRRMINSSAGVLGTMLWGGKAGWLSGSIELGVDLIYNTIINSYYEKREDREASIAPTTLFYSSEDNPLGMGVFDPQARMIKSVARIKETPTNKYPSDPEIAQDLFQLRILNAVAQSGILGADVKRLTSQVVYGLESIAKDTLFDMPDSYGVVKQATVKYKLKPITPFEEEVIYLRDPYADTQKEVKLSKDKIREINSSIGKLMPGYLEDMGYSKNIAAFDPKNSSAEEVVEAFKKAYKKSLKDVMSEMYVDQVLISKERFEKDENSN